MAETMKSTAHSHSVLFTFLGPEDPYSQKAGSHRQSGPVLHLVNLRRFTHVILLATPETLARAEKAEKALRQEQPGLDVRILSLTLQDPTDYTQILELLRERVRPVMAEFGEGDLFIATASGTPQMHACWILLVVTGELPARVLHLRPPRYVCEDYPVVRELDLSDAVFPSLTTPEAGAVAGEAMEPPASPRPDAARVARQAGILGDHPELLRAVGVAVTLAPFDVPLLLRGETGTGKDLLAQLIHRESGRPPEKFITVNCSTLPPDLAESILFGHVQGSFTGAGRDHLGKFQQADGGTLYLEDLGELSLPAQAKLLRAMETQVIEPLGSESPVSINVRVIGATNRGLQQDIREGSFRRDLYYRFADEIHLLPLRERRGDIPRIALAMLDRLNSSFAEPRRLSQSALEKLRKAYWHGNVRDLQNVIERAALTCNAPVIEPEHLVLRESFANPELISIPEPYEGFSMEDYLSRVRRMLIQRSLKIAGNNKSQAARLLGVTPQAVHKYLKLRREKERDDREQEPQTAPK
jgi:transcriptional regulator with PAS, ATPase and Fis domain